MSYERVSKTWSVNVLGYFISVLGAAAVATLILGIIALFSIRSIADIGEILGLGIPMLVTSSLFIGATSWPGYILALIMADRLNAHSAVFYTFMGLLNVLAAFAIVAIFISPLIFTEFYFLLLICLPAGAAGGYTFFKLHEKNLS